MEAVTGLDRYQFARQFRALCGTSPYRYSVMRRLGVARDWLRDARRLGDEVRQIRDGEERCPGAWRRRARAVRA